MNLRFTFMNCKESAYDFAKHVNDVVNENSQNGIGCESIEIKTSGIKSKDDLMMKCLRELSPVIYKMTTLVNHF